MNKVIFLTILLIASIAGLLIVRYQLNMPIGVDCFPSPDMAVRREQGIEVEINAIQRIARDHFHYQPRVYCSSM